MNRVLIVLFFSLAASAALHAQSSSYTLEQCIETAIKNNIEVRQADLQTEAAEVVRRQARANLLPNLNGAFSHGINQGRSIDPFTNTYVNQKVNYSNIGIGSNVVLFNGFSQQNAIRQAGYALEASRMELEQAKEALTLNVILAYLQVLSNEDLLEVSKRQVAVSQKQVERLEVLNKEGAISPSQLYDLIGQQKDNELAVVTAQNAVATSRLTLAQLMNIPYDPAMQLERLGMEDLQKFGSSAQEVYNTALNELALVKAAELRRQSAAAAVKAVRGQLFPQLSLGGNLNTTYSSAATRDVLLNSTETTTADYVILNGSKLPVMTSRNNFSTEKISYGSQLKNNVFSNIGVTLSIPLFNSLQTRNRVRLAGIELKSIALQEENTKVQLRQEVEQAYVNMTNAWDRYKILLEQVTAFAESFRAAEVRFNAGVGTSVDYLIAKNNLDRANLNLITAKYDYLLRKRILEYYQGAQTRR